MEVNPYQAPIDCEKSKASRFRVSGPVWGLLTVAAGCGVIVFDHYLRASEVGPLSARYIGTFVTLAWLLLMVLPAPFIWHYMERTARRDKG